MLLQTVLTLLLKPKALAFERTLMAPEASQRRLLKELVRLGAETSYGSQYRLTSTDGYEEFARKMPIVTYDDLGAWVERQKRGEGRVLCADPVLLYEKTSGSSGPAKYIPYTRKLKRSFTEMFLLWMHDVLANGPRFATGKLYFSVSPSFAEETQTASGVPVGLEDDSEYLQGWSRSLLQRFVVVPSSIKRIGDPERFKRELSLALLEEAGLEIVSVWNPTFFELILKFIEKNRESLLRELKRKDLGRLLRKQPMAWGEIWPRLKLISCWKAGAAEAPFVRLQRLFPGVLLQPKGLLATEAPLTIPWLKAGGFVPLAHEVFYEFEEEDGRIRLLHQLEVGRSYQLILSQKGGLLRYRIGDQVKVTGFYRKTPLLEFVGRSSGTSDLVGEKLSESFVQEALREALPGFDGFSMLLPRLAEGGARYLLVLDRAPAEIQSEPNGLAHRLDLELSRSYHYRYARLLGQLAIPLVLIRAGAEKDFYEHYQRKGMKLGDIKARALITRLQDADALAQLWADQGLKQD